MYQPIIDKVEQAYRRQEPLEFRIGDTVDVHVKIIEGDKERIQVYNGVVIARRGHGLSETFTVRRIVANQGVERVFMVHSPRITKVEVRRHGKVRRAKLYFLRDRVGKARRLREKRRASTRTSAGDKKAGAPTTVGVENADAEVVGVGS